MLDVSLLVKVSLVLCVTQLCFLFCVSGVVAAVHADLGGIDLDDFRYNFIKEITVMGDDKYSTRIIQKISFQPGDAFHIEVVGWLIEEKDIRFGDQEFAECDTGLLSTGEGFDLFGKIFVGKAKTFEHAHQFALIGVAVFQLKFVGQAGVGVHQTVKFLAGSVFHLDLDRAHAVFHIDDVLFGREQFLVDGTVSADILILCEIADLFVLHQNDLTGICRDFIHYNTEKGCLTCSVVADESGFFTLFYMK